MKPRVQGEWRKGKNCNLCYFFNPDLHACAISEYLDGKECNKHFVDWDLLLEVYPWDPMLKRYFSKEVIERRIRLLEGDEAE